MKNQMSSRTLEQMMEDHIYIEYRYGVRSSKDKLLAEEHGYVPQIDEYIDELSDFFDDNVVSMFNELLDNGSKETIGFQITEPSDIWKKTQTFFNDCNIIFYFGIIDNGVIADGGYNSTLSKFSESQIKLVIELTIKGCDSAQVKRNFLMVFAHELTHAYDDYNRFKKGGHSLMQYADDTGYNDIIKTLDYPFSTMDVPIADMFYKLSAVERNAFIGQLKTELRNYKKCVMSSSDAMNILQQTRSWAKYKSLAQNVAIVNSLDEIHNAVDIYKILVSVNRFSKKKIRTFNQFKKLLNRRWNNWSRKYMTQASKIVYDTLRIENSRIMDDSHNILNNDPILKIKSDEQ